MGSAGVSLTALDAIAQDSRLEVVGAVTQPDRPRKRGGHAASCEVKARALELGVPVMTPEKINTPDALEELAGYQADVMAVVAYGQFLGKSVREMAPMGCVNLHLSLLPKYRGAAPVQWAIVAGDEETGVTSMRINAGMDTGDILLQERVKIGEQESAGDLFDRLAILGAPLLVRTLHALADNVIESIPQDEAAATLAPKLKKRDGRIDWTRSAAEICQRIRGFNPWPGSFCMLPATHAGGTAAKPARGSRHQGPMLKIHRAVPLPGEGRPGEVLCCGETGLQIATGEGAICVRELQPEGRRRMSVGDYIHGHTVCAGDLLT